MLFNPRIRNLILLYLSAISVFVGIMINFFLILRGGLFLFLASERVENKCNSSLCFLTSERFKGPRVPKKAQFTHEQVEYSVFLFDEPLKGSKSLKIFKISLTFRFEKL
jgi:hypothetical protein